MTLIKTSFWTGFSVIIKIIAVFLTSKIIAIYTGPVGLAFIEQFQNFIQIVRTFSGSLVQQGVIKYIAEFRKDENNKSYIISSALIISLTVSIFISLFLFYFNSEIAYLILRSTQYAKLIKIFAASLILFSLNNLVLAILNGELEIKKYVACNIVNTIVMLLITVLLIRFYNIEGGLLALIFNQSIILFFSLFLLTKCKWFKIQLFLKGIHFDSLSKLAMYVLITIITMVTVPFSQLIVRSYIAHTLSWEEAGYWQGMMKLSNNYAILIDSLLCIYYLPTLSAIKSLVDLRKEIFNGYKFIIPIAFFAAACIFILKKYIVIILYSKQFLPMLFLFKYQLFGDIARTAAWLLSYVMIAKTMVKPLIAVEVSFMLYYSLLNIVLVHYFGLTGTAIGFAISYFLYWISMVIFIKKATDDKI